MNVMGTPSPSGAMDSSVMYLLETAHSSFCSRRIEPCDGVFVGKDAARHGAVRSNATSGGAPWGSSCRRGRRARLRPGRRAWGPCLSWSTGPSRCRRPPGRRRWRRRRRRRADPRMGRHEVHAALEDPGRGGLHGRRSPASRRAARAGPASAGTQSRIRRADMPTSRRPWSLTATATVTATETMRPVWA